MVNINLESIIIYADAEPTLRDMFNPRIDFYAIALAWDSNGEVHKVYGNLPLRLSYNDTRRYEGDAMPLLTNYDTSNLNICIFAYYYDNDRLQHKKILRGIKNGIDKFFLKNNEQITNYLEGEKKKYQQQRSENIKSCIKRLSKKAGINMVNIFENTLDINDMECDENVSIINHYQKISEIKLSIKT